MTLCFLWETLTPLSARQSFI